mgnify:CR=1 FL=1
MLDNPGKVDPTVARRVEGLIDLLRMLAERGDDGRLHWRAINSCIRLAHSVQGMAVFTAEDIAGADGTLHPAQRAMVVT